MSKTDFETVDQTNHSNTTETPAPPRRGKLPPWKVLLHNDDVNGMLFVVESIQMIVRKPRNESVVLMLEAHQNGTALLTTTHKERAELLQEQFTSRQLTVTIEPVLADV